MAANPNAPLKADDTLGFSQEFLRPGRNVLGWASGVPVLGQGLDALSRAVNGGESLKDAIGGYDSVVPQAAIQGRKPGLFGSMAGSLVGSLPALAVPGGPLAQGAVAGALTTDKPNDPGSVALSAGGGALLGKAGDVVGNAVLDTVAPKIVPAAQNLLNRNVPLTTDMLTGGSGVLGKAGALAKTIPVTGELSRTRDNEALRGFTKAFGDEALSPIGADLQGKTGHDLYQSAKDHIAEAYDKVGRGVDVPIDQQFLSDLKPITDSANNGGLPTDLKNRYQYLMNRDLMGRISDVNPTAGTNMLTVPGQSGVRGFTASDLADTKAAINKEIGRFKEPSGFDSVYVDHLRDTRNALTNMLGRTSPQAQADLAAADAAYPGFKVFQKAIKNANQNRTSPNGFFTPQMADSAINQGAGMDARASRAGPLNQLAADGKEVLPRGFAKPVSAMSAAIEAGVGAGVVGSEVFGHAGVPLIAAPALTAPLYSRAAQTMLRSGLVRSAAVRQAAESSVGPLSNYVRLPAGLIGGTAASQLAGALSPTQ